MIEKHEYTVTHTIGYSVVFLQIHKDITQEDIDELKNALAAYSDEPNQENFDEMLLDEEFCNDHDITPKLRKLARNLIVSSEAVHREYDVF